MENEHIITKEFLESGRTPKTIFERIYVNCFKNLGLGMMPSRIELNENEYSKFYISSKKVNSLEEATNFIEDAFKKESFYDFKKNKKRKSGKNIINV